jgi:hypothetical protein
MATQHDSARQSDKSRPALRLDSSQPIRTVRPGFDRQADRDRRQRIAEAAYFLAEARAFAPGHEEEDWLAAEARVDALDSFLA